MSGNTLALYGCDESGVAIFDYYTSFLVVGVLLAFQGLIMFLSPFEIAPGEGNFKYLLLKVSSAFGEDMDGEWRVYGACATHFSGALLGGISVYAFWASKNWDDYTFMHATIAYMAMILFAWVTCFIRFRSELKLLGIAPWLIPPVVSLILAIVILSDHDTDAEQLKSTQYGGATEGVDPENLLWVMAALHILTAVSSVAMYIEPLEKFVLKLNFREDGYEPSNLDRVQGRFLGVANVANALVPLWAAINFDKAPGDVNATFPLLMWLGFAALLVFMIWHTVSPGWDKCWLPHFVANIVLVLASATTAQLIGWYIGCHNGNV